MESEENEAKIVKWRYLRLWWVVVELLGTSASSYVLERRDLPAAMAHGCEQGMEKGRGGAQPL